MDDNIQKKLDEFAQSEKRTKRLFRDVVILLIIMFVVGIVWGLNSILTGGNMDIPVSAEGFAADKPQTKDDAISLFGRMLSFTFDEENAKKVKIGISTSLSLDGDSLKSDAPDEYFNELVKYIKDGDSGVLDKLKKSVYSYGDNDPDNPDYSAPFGTKISDKMIVPDIKADDLQSFSFELEEDHEDVRHLTLVFNDEAYPPEPGTALYKNFNMSRCGDYTKAITEFFAKTATVDSAEISCDDFKIDLPIDSITGDIKGLNYIRNYNVKLRVTFTGELAAAGTRELSFKFSANEHYSFTFAGVRLSEHTMWLEKGDTDNLEAFRTAEEEFSVKWESSNPDIAEVDNEGYIKGKAVSAEPVIISASFEYLGNTFTDSCEVYVRKPVKGIKLHTRELSLSPGEKHAFSVTFSPENATVRDIFWMSSDESILTVDENGTVTAVNEGKATLYAVSIDGNYKAFCEITVNGGAANG